MKKILTLLIILSLCLTSAFSYGAFDDAVDDSRKKNNSSERNKKTEPSESTSTSSSSAESACCEALCQICSSEMLTIWFYNMEANYLPYPYYNSSNKYIHYKSESNTSKYDSMGRKVRLSLDSSFVWLKDLGIGNNSSFNCMIFPLVGLFGENLLLHDHIHDEGNMGTIKLGAQIPVIQSTPISILLKAGWTTWYGETDSFLKKNVMIIGVELMSYPVQPLALRCKFDWQFFPENIYILDTDIQAGICINRAEIFAGWKHINLGNRDAANQSHGWSGINSGIRLYF